MTKVEVDTFQNVTVLQRSLRTEHDVRAILLECAGAFSPRVEDRSVNGVFVCALDIAGTEGLFGPPLLLAKQLRQRLRSLSIMAFVTMSANLHTAVCIARGLTGGVPIQVVRRGDEAKALSSLPLSVLDISEGQAETFRAWGIRSVGALAALPEKSLISRLGQDAKRLLQLAQGKQQHLLQPIDVPFVLEEHAELDSPLDDLDSLLFGVSTMLEQLIFRAKSRVYALSSVTITLHLDGGGSHERTVNPRVPTNDKKLWLKLLHLDLQNHPPQTSILAVHLHAEPGETSKVQLGLFSPQLPEPGKLDVALAKITAIVGEGNVGQDLPRHLGQHSGGMVICQGALDKVVPLERASMAGRTVVQWDKEDCANLHIIKVDLLGLGMMAVLKDCLTLVPQHYGESIDLAQLPEDQEVYRTLQRATLLFSTVQRPAEKDHLEPKREANP